MILVGLVAVATLAGWRRFGQSIETRAEAQARCVDSLDCGAGAPAGARVPSPLLGAAAVSGPQAAAPETSSNPDVAEGDGPTPEYKPYDGKPFVKNSGEPHEVDPSDVDQGSLSDCYVVASLGGLALRNPDLIRNAVRDNGDGTYTVTFYEEGFWWWSDYEKVEVTVNGDFPMVDGEPYYMRPGEGDEMWPMIVEKAYAQWQGGYGDIEEGAAADMLEALTGQESDWDDDFDSLADHWDAGDVVTLATADADEKDRGPLYKDTLNTNHEYYVTNVDREKGTMTIRNPFGWDEDPITLTFAEVEQHFVQMTWNPGGR